MHRLSSDAALEARARLQAIFRDAVLAAAPARYSPAQCAAWASTADDEHRWTPWLVDGSTWIATQEASDEPVGFGMTCPADSIHLLYVDPRFHRRGIARALLALLEDEARDRGIDALTTDASLVSHPLFAATGYDVVAWEDVVRNGESFRRARMRKTLR